MPIAIRRSTARLRVPTGRKRSSDGDLVAGGGPTTQVRIRATAYRDRSMRCHRRPRRARCLVLLATTLAAIAGCGAPAVPAPPRGYAYPVGSQTEHLGADGSFAFARMGQVGTIALGGLDGRSRRISRRARGHAFPGDYDPSLSPDHRSVAYVRAYAKTGTHTQTTIRVVDVRGGVTRTVLRRPRGRQDISGVTWAPDGRHLAVVLAAGAGGDRPGIYGLDLATGKLSPLLIGSLARSSRDPLRFPTSPSWSADGRSIVAEGRRGYATVLDLATGQARVLDQRSVIAPVYSPDGQTIAYATNRDDNGSVAEGSDDTRSASELHLMNADGTNDRRLTNTEYRDENQPAWLDQHTLLYAEGQDSAIWRLDIATGHTRQIIKPHHFYSGGVATAP